MKSHRVTLHRILAWEMCETVQPERQPSLLDSERTVGTVKLISAIPEVKTGKVVILPISKS